MRQRLFLIDLRFEQAENSPMWLAVLLKSGPTIMEQLYGSSPPTHEGISALTTISLIIGIIFSVLSSIAIVVKLLDRFSSPNQSLSHIPVQHVTQYVIINQYVYVYYNGYYYPSYYLIPAQRQ
jgi:hypothetical protein